MTEQLAPRCERCTKRHRPDLRCWSGPYAQRLAEQVYREKGRRCWQCRREGKDVRATTVDHIQARARGGGDDMRNLEPYCAQHNSSKGARTMSPYPDPPRNAGNGEPVSPRYR